MKRILALMLMLPGTAAAQVTGVTLTSADCRILERHQPAPDVAYRPGLDSRGRPVAPADLPGSQQIEIPQVPEFVIALDPLEYQPRQDLAAIDRLIASLPPGDPRLPPLLEERGRAERAVGLAAPGLGDSSLAVGRVRIDTQTGAASFNGRHLGAPEREAMIVACRRVPRP